MVQLHRRSLLAAGLTGGAAAFFGPLRALADLPARSLAELPAMKYAMPFCGVIRS